MQQSIHNFKGHQLHLSQFNGKNKADNASVPAESTEVVPLQTEVRGIQANGPPQHAEIETSRKESQIEMIKKGELEF